MKDHHKLLGIWILLGIAFASVFIINVPLSPPYHTETEITTLQFHAFGTSQNILLDDTPSFSSPLLVHKGESITLSPGTYYWKTEGISLVSTFTIISTVALEIGEADEEQRITNVGNVPAQVTVRKNKPSLTGSFILDPQENIQIPIEKETALIGEQHEEP
ncbi:MAG: hypothetical protein AABW64_03920 [Nanoarchaeota archaeon]